MLDSMHAGRRALLGFAGLGLGLAASAVGGGAPALAEAARVAHALFDVRAYGAKGDGKTLDTDAVNRAIAAAGGGTVLFPAGDYLCFSIHLKSRVHLVLAQGSTIIAADSPLPGQTGGYRGGS